MVLTEYKIDDEVIEILTQFIGGTTSEIQVIHFLLNVRFLTILYFILHL